MECSAITVNSVILEMERALDLTMRLQSLLKVGSYGEPLKESARFLSDEVLQTCNATLSALDSRLKIDTRKRKLQGAAAVRGRDLRSRSSVREQVTAAPYDDGHQWRKYGEKVIKGCFSPRSYFRCTFSDEKRCQARKQVQQDPNDPALFLVIYRGEHSCSSNDAALFGSSFQTAPSSLTPSPAGSPPPQDHAPFQLLSFDSKRPPETMPTESENKFMMISSRMSTAKIGDEDLRGSTSAASSCNKVEPSADCSALIIDEDGDAFGRETLFPSSTAVEEIDLEFDIDGLWED